jgi:ATPase subunit of ABC transporter with duplicated ATPase domains
MISTENLALSYGKRVLFEDVNINFTAGNCYGLIGANGSGKSTFLKILSGEIEPTKGTVSVLKDKRLAVLKQNHFEYDKYEVLETVMMGHKKLYDTMKKRDALYAKPDFNDEDGMEVANLESEFTHLNGWEAESDAARLLSDLHIGEDLHKRHMKELNGSEKVRVLLAQALFGNPDILLMDEPTNGLDIETVNWLEDFLYDFENTVIVVSHDRHFLDKVCTQIADIDYGTVQLFTGNFTFWRQASELAMQQKRDSNKKKEERIEELKVFVARFSANASKAKQATARQNLIEKITLDDIKPSSRRYPRVVFVPNREAGNNVLEVSDISRTKLKIELFKGLSFEINKGDKVALLGKNRIALTALFKVLAEERSPDTGFIKWGVTTTRAYLPNDNAKYFETDINMIDWLRQYSVEKDESFIRGFLGKMLFTGEETLKAMNVLSGGERVRCMLARMMLLGANVLLLDEPTNHLDLESITALNDALVDFRGSVIFTSHDHTFTQTIANRVIEVLDNGIIDKLMTIDEYLEYKHNYEKNIKE